MINDLKRLYIFEHSPEAVEAIENGSARISAGGIIRAKGTDGPDFVELAKPATISVADFFDEFESKEHSLEVDNQLKELTMQLTSINDGVEKIRDVFKFSHRFRPPKSPLSIIAKLNDA